MRATLVSPGLLENDACALIALEVPHRKPLSDEELIARYMLTAREIEVARLLADGKQTSEVAETLGISTHTARHHTEHVLAKLGVISRAAVASALASRG